MDIALNRATAMNEKRILEFLFFLCNLDCFRDLRLYYKMLLKMPFDNYYKC